MCNSTTVFKKLNFCRLPYISIAKWCRITWKTVMDVIELFSPYNKLFVIYCSIT